MLLMAGLQRHGWAVTLATPGPGILADQARAAGFKWTPLALGGLNRRHGLPALRAWPRAMQLAREHDVVYLNGGVCGRLLPALVLVRRNRSRAAPGQGTRPHRIVLHVHDIVERVPNHWRGADVVLADSGAVASALGGLSSEVVYCPVDPDPPRVCPPWPKGGGPVIAFVGRIEPRKGTLDFVLAAPAIRARVPDARVVLVGEDVYDTDREYRQRVLSRPGVEHYPWMDNAAGLMRHIDVLVLPSQEEPFGTVLAEAMAVGTPVVATDVGGVAEVVQDGASGRLIGPGDPERMAEAVAEVHACRERIGAAAQAQARRFHVEAYVERVEGLIAG